MISRKASLSLEHFQILKLKNAYFDCLPTSNRKNDDLQSTHCHSSFYSGLKFEQKLSEVSGFSLVTFLTNIYCTVCVWEGKVIEFIVKPLDG